MLLSDLSARRLPVMRDAQRAATYVPAVTWLKLPFHIIFRLECTVHSAKYFIYSTYVIMSFSHNLTAFWFATITNEWRMNRFFLFLSVHHKIITFMNKILIRFPSDNYLAFKITERFFFFAIHTTLFVRMSDTWNTRTSLGATIEWHSQSTFNTKHTWSSYCFLYTNRLK